MTDKASKRRRRRLRGRLTAALAKLDGMNIFRPAEDIPVSTGTVLFFERQLAEAERIMREDNAILRELVRR